MATASGINKVVSYKKETYQSEEIRTDYQLVDFRHGVRAVEGSISGELSAGTYADFLASALARNWTAATPSALGSTTIATVGGTYTITRTTGSWLTDTVRVGNVIRLTGFATANNNANLLVIALTATVATVVALNGVKLTNETVASGGAFVATGKTTYAPTTGHTDDSYTFEEWYSDIGQSEVTVGNKVNTVGIALPATGLTTVDLSFMGQDLAKRGTSQFFTNPTAQNSNGIFAAVNGALIVNGAPVALVTGANFNINRNMTSEAVVGSNIKPEIYEGRIIVDGDFTTLYQDGTFAGYFDNETEISLVVALTANSLPNSEFMSFTIPRLKLSTDTKDDGEKGIVSSNSFQALKGDGANGFEATTLMIQDSTLI